jgi:hypothetical protein
MTIEKAETEIDAMEIDQLPTLPEELSHPSFFSLSPEHTAVVDLFADAVQKGNVENFLSSPVFSKHPVSMPSLLARAWCTLSYPADVRTTALNIFSQYSSEAGPSFDFQGFLPYLITSLANSSKEIRNEAADALIALRQLYSTPEKNVTVVGLTDLYGHETGELKWLLAAEASWLVTGVTDSHAECRLDSNYVFRLLAGILNEAGKKGKRDQYCLFSSSLI